LSRDAEPKADEKRHTSIDLEIKFLLYELGILGTILKSSSFQPTDYDTLPIHIFLRDHRTILMMLLTLVAGSRFTLRDLRHEDGTRKDEKFEGAVAAVMGSLARHSAGVNGWWECSRCSVERDGIASSSMV
jgi:hypothetical protein